MNAWFRGFGAVLYKEFLVLFRDRGTLFFMFFPPLLQIIAFGFALDTDVKHMALAVYDEDRTRESRQFVEQLVNTKTFRVVRHVESADALAAEIRRGRAYAGVQIPPEFTRNLRGGRTARVQVLIDGSNSTTALQALHTALGVAFRQSLLILLGESGRREMPLEVRPQVLYNPEMKSPNFFLPGVMGVAIQIAAVFATAMSLVREKERGTLENLLVSPLSRPGLMLGKLLPYLCLTMTMGTLLLGILRWVFDVPVRGSLPGLFLCLFLFVFTLLSAGLLISTRASSQMEALQMTMVLLLPSIFFSGFIFPRETMPWIFYALSTLIPTTYFIELTRAIILRGATLTEFVGHVAILTLMGGTLFSLAALRFRRTIG